MNPKEEVNAKITEDEQKIKDAQKLIEEKEKVISMKCMQEIDVILKKYNRVLTAVPQIRIAK